MYTIGVDIGGTNIKIGLVDDQLNIVRRSSIPFPHLDGAGVSAVIAEESRSLLQAHGLTEEQLDSVGVVVPGSIDLAWASSEKMKDYDAVVWAHHGLFASGPDFDTAFGLMHTVEKAAQVRVLAMNAGGPKRVITDDEIRAIAEGCGVQIREAFLDLNV